MNQISNIDLYFNQYNVEELAHSIKMWPFLPLREKCKYQRLNLCTILHTQKLTAEFCIKYIFNEKYAYTEDEVYIVDNAVLRLQPHITKQELRHAWHEYGCNIYG